MVKRFLKTPLTDPRWLYTVLLLAVVVRLGLLLAMPSVFDFVATGAVHGSEAYDTYAQNLVSTGVFGRVPGVADATIPPLYPHLLALVYGVFGRSYWVVGALHSVLDCLTITCLYGIGARLLNQRHALIAALLTAVYPYLIFQNMTVIDTPLFMTLLYGFLYSVLLLRECQRFDRRAVLIVLVAGAALGLATLVRPITPFLAVLVGLWFLFRWSLWQTLLRLLPVALLSVLMVSAWIVRNERVFHAFVPMTTTSGGNFWQGNNRFTVPFFQAGYDVQWGRPSAEEMPDLNPADPKVDAQLLALGWAYLREHTAQIPLLLWTKFQIHWSIDIAPRNNPRAGDILALDANGNFVLTRQNANGEALTFGASDPVNLYSESGFDTLARWVHRFYWGAAFLLGLIGLWATWRRWRDVALLWFVQISMTLVYMIYHPSTRYRVPTDPAWFLLTAAGIFAVWAWVQRRKV